MRTIKLISLTGLVLFLLAGVPAYFVTQEITASISGGGLLVAAWSNAGLGIMISTIFVSIMRGSGYFGSTKMYVELFGGFAIIMVVTAVVEFVIGGLVYSAITSNGSAPWDAGVYLTFALSCMIGLWFTFLIQVAIFVDGTWFNANAAGGSVKSLREAS